MPIDSQLDTPSLVHIVKDSSPRLFIDLLKKATEISESCVLAHLDPFVNPIEFLDTEQRRWLEPLDTKKKIFRRTLYLFNRLFHLIYFRLTVHGIENLLSAGQCIITPNHVSYIDSFVMGAAIPYHFLLNTVWAAGVEVAFRNPINRFVSRLAGALPIEHGMGARTDMAFAAVAIDNNKNLIWYPEGRRAPGKELLPFRPGIGLLLQRKELSIVPVIIHGTDKAMPIGKIVPRPAHIIITFGKAISHKELAELKSSNEVSNRRKIVNTLRIRMGKNANLFTF